MKIKSYEDLGLTQGDYYQSKFVLDDGKTIITSLSKEYAGAFHVFGNREQTRLFFAKMELLHLGVSEEEFNEFVNR